MPRGTTKSEGASGTPSDFIDPATITGGGNASGSGIGDPERTDKHGTKFDANIHSHPDTLNSDGSFRRKRGRRTGSGANKSKAQIYSDIEKSAEMLTRGLMIFHSSLSAITQTPELELDEAEAKGLSESSLTLLALYDIKPDPKIEAAILFAGQVGLIYGTRIVAIRARKASEKKAERAAKASVHNPDGTTTQTDFHVMPEWPLGGAPVN